MQFVSFLFCLLLLMGQSKAGGGLLSPTLRKDIEKTPERVLLDAKKIDYFKDVFGQFLLYLAINLDLPITQEENTPEKLKLLNYESKKEELKTSLFNYVNVVKGVSFSDKTCQYTFSSNSTNMTADADECEGHAEIADLGDTSPLDYVLDKIDGEGKEINEERFVFLLGKGEGADMEVFIAIEIQPFKLGKKPVQKAEKESDHNIDEIKLERRLKGEDEEIELVIRILNSVAESKLKIQYAEQSLPSTNTFLNNVVTGFMLKNDQLIFNLEELKQDLVKMLVHNFTSDQVDEANFNINKYELKSDSDIHDTIKNENIKDPKELDRLQFDSIKFHLNFIQLKEKGSDVKNYFNLFHAKGNKTIENHLEGEELSQADEQLLFLLTPSFMNISPISVIVTRKGLTLRLIFHSSYFETTEYFSFAARPFVTKTIERRIKRIADKIIRPISILEHQNQDNSFNPDKENSTMGYVFANTLLKEIDSFYKAEQFDGSVEPDQLTQVAQNLVKIVDKPNDLKDCAEDKPFEPLLCIALNTTDLDQRGVNMLEIHHKILKPHSHQFIKRFPTQSLYDIGLFAKSYARYLVDLIISITSVGEHVNSPTLFKHTFPPFEPTMQGISVKYINNDVFELNESGAEPLSIRGDLKLKLISPQKDDQKVKTVGYEYVTPSQNPSRFNQYLKG